MAPTTQSPPVRSRTAEAFAPAAITNFFSVKRSDDGRPVGATGGGYVLSRGVLSRAVYSQGGKSGLKMEVNGDSSYDARTTSRAVRMLMKSSPSPGRLSLKQSVEVPIGAGFGASAASAVSGVYAAAAASGVSIDRESLALFAHLAEIEEQTGLGTVSVVYTGIGAGAITLPGEPGKAEFLNVVVPSETRLVTATLGPFDKKKALSSASFTRKINLLGEAALRAFLADPTLDSLASEGEKFSKALGLETPELKKIIDSAKKAGAVRASQNMIGYAVHALTDSDEAAKVVSALSAYRSARVDLLEIGSVRADVLSVSRR